MPKTRSSGTIANRNSGSRSGSGGGSGGASGGIGSDGTQEMSNRLDERLSVARSVVVEVDSRTRGTRENITVTFDPSTPGRAAVLSGSGRMYAVNTEENTCTCPDHRLRGSRCRHIEATAIAQEQISQGTHIGSARAEDINANETLREHINNEAVLERENAERVFSDDGHFYSDNREEFERDLERLRNSPVPYEYHNVLNGSDITFGIELEFVNGDSNAIARELYNLGICSSPHMEGYHSRGVPGKWKLERDGSVTSGNRGGELVSPVLQDTPETWHQIETICQVARRHGATVNSSTGGHVHVSVEPLDGKRQRWRRLFKAFKGNEEAIYRASGGELGRVRNTYYAASSVLNMERGIRARLPQEGSLEDFRRAINNSSMQAIKYSSLNISPFVSGTRPTIEVRAFNGSLTPGIIQANIKIATGLIHTAERSRIQGGNEGPTTESFRRRGRLINEHENNTRDNDSIVKFVDTFFTRKSDKEHILSVMAKNSWR